MKKFISGIIVGVLISSTVAFAASYVANPAGFKVLVNGKEFTSDPPAMVINDRTYLPLRAIGDALGVPVNWNEELGQAEVGSSSNIVYYEKTPWCPDFGAYTGLVVDRIVEIETGCAYIYKIDYSKLDTKGLDDYGITILPEAGFSFITSDDGGMFYRKGNYGLNIEFDTNKGEIVVLTWEYNN
jgi:cellulosome anchoring protein cohesin region